MFYHGTYKIENEKVIYEPCAGLTIKEAIHYAIDLAKQEKKSLILYINDINIEVNQNSNPISIATKFFMKLERKTKKEQFKNKINKTM